MVDFLWEPAMPSLGLGFNLYFLGKLKGLVRSVIFHTNLLKGGEGHILLASETRKKNGIIGRFKVNLEVTRA